MMYGERLMQKRKEEIVPKFRKMGNSKIYHIMIKGIDGQNIFYDDKDRRNFLRKFLENKKVAVWIKKHDDVKEKLQEIFSNTEKMQEMKINARLLAKQNSTADICKIILN